MSSKDFIKIFNYKVIDSVNSHDALHLYNLHNKYNLGYPLSSLLLFNKELTSDIENKIIKNKKRSKN